MTALKLKLTDVSDALMRLLWTSVADRDDCTCEMDDDVVVDPCSLCQACVVLGFGRYQGPDWLRRHLESAQEKPWTAEERERLNRQFLPDKKQDACDKPCPFCGESALERLRVVEDFPLQKAWVECWSCHARGPSAFPIFPGYPAEPEAREKWRSRTIFDGVEDDPPPELQPQPAPANPP